MRHAHLSSVAIVVSLGLFAMPAAAQDRTIETQLGAIAVQTVAEGLEHPWGLAFLPDGRFLVTERNPGNLRIGNADGTLSEPVEGVPEVFRFKGETSRSQGGLFDVALHPQFDENRLVYLSLSKPSERGAGTAIVRGRLVEEGERPRLEDVETVFEMKEEDQDSSGLHFGGRMVFHPADGHIYLSIGERRNISRSQDGNDQAGSIIRVTDEGGVPPDNPFVGDENRDDKIYAMGIRNSQGLAIHTETGALWASDHGPRGGDEINRIEPGANYGWPFLTAGVDYSGASIGGDIGQEDMTPPVHVFEETVAPSGLVFYAGEPFAPWNGDLLVGGLRTEGIVRLRLEGDTVVAEEPIEIGRRIRDVKVADDGAIWLLTEHEDGEVLRLTPAPG